MSDRRNGREHWRSFEQMAGSEASIKHLENEFPDYDPQEIASLPRRRFLKLSAAAMALVGVTSAGCRRWPKEHLVPSTAGLRDQLPGVPEFYATGLERNGVADALLVTSYDGRPLKIEGNPLHPLFTTWKKADGTPVVGASNKYAQASVLEMYDPARGRRVIADSNTKKAKSSTWDAFFADFEKVAQGSNGINLAVLSEACSGISYAAAKAAFLKRFPQAQWAEYEPLARDAEMQAGMDAFGASVRPIYDLTKAKTIVSLDGDLFGTHPNKIRHANDWSQGRRSIDGQAKSMNRLYIAESTMSQTGSAADVRLPVRPSHLSAIALALAVALGVPGVVAAGELTEPQKKWVADAAADLKSASGVVAVGTHAPSQIQSLAYAINFAINAVGNSVTFVELPANPPQIQSLRNLCDRMTAGQINGLLILGGNPAYDAPADLDFTSKLANVALTAHLSLYPDETSHACKWHLPKSHYLEAWGDARAWDGSLVIQQPLILPLYDSRSPIELVATLAKSEATDGLTITRNALAGITKDEAGWRTSLHDGIVKGTAFAVAKTGAPKNISVYPTQATGAFELRFVESAVFDGRYANNGWLQEVPDAISKLTWDNAALMNKTDRDALDLVDGDLIKITVGSSMSLELPVFSVWGQPKGVIALPLGYGRTAAGPIGGDTLGADGAEPVGFDTYKIRRSDQMFVVTGGVNVAKSDGSHDLVSLQNFQQLDWAGEKGYVDRVGAEGESGRIVRETSMAKYLANPSFVDHVGHRLPLLQLWDSPYPPLDKAAEIKARDPDAPQAFNVPHAWAMSIDMSTCIGCNACVIACQSENNIPTVGKSMMKMNRGMHWIRIDRYFKAKLNDDRRPVNDDYENVEVTYQPMMCVHCENAPCEQVCPVAATVHDTEGLNTMVYNRCIGTRYCANNCPYKVRRFNFFDYGNEAARTSARGIHLVDVGPKNLIRDPTALRERSKITKLE